MSKLYNLYAPLGSEFSCPDTELIPPKTAGNQFQNASRLGSKAGWLGVTNLVSLEEKHRTL